MCTLVCARLIASRSALSESVGCTWILTSWLITRSTVFGFGVPAVSSSSPVAVVSSSSPAAEPGVFFFVPPDVDGASSPSVADGIAPPGEVPPGVRTRSAEPHAARSAATAKRYHPGRGTALHWLTRPDRQPE